MAQVTVKTDIPQTVNYQSCTVQVGTTTTLASDQNATVTNTGTEYNAVLNFGIPRGKSAYEQAVEGGYQGTEEEFEQALASDIATVVDNISDINAVGQSITEVKSVADNLTDVSTVADNVSDVNTVAGISSDVTQVSGISNAVQTVSSHDSEVTLVSDNMASVMTTASNIGDVSTVAGISTDVSTVADNNSNVTAVAGNSTNINAVAANEANINAVNANKTNIDAVAGNNTNVTTVATNISNVNTAATNMAAIIAAPTAAQNAANSATNAQTWAEGTDTAVTALGGEHSSKGWADVARQYAESIGAALKYKGSVSTYSALPATGQEIGDMWNVLDTGKNYAWTGTEWDDLAGVVDLSAYRTAANQDIIDGNLSTAITNHTGNTSNPHSVTASQVGLGNVDNTSDLNKPISTATQTALNAKQDTLVSGTNIKTVNGNSLLGSGNLNINALPSQTGQSGKFLTTDGTDASWANIDALPSQTGQSGKFLTTNGSAASWSNVDALPTQTGQQGKYLTTNGTTASWDIPMAGLPMFYATYQPRKLNNASWLRADPYSWHSADLYVSAYAHLADNISGVNAQTETIAGTTITFYKLSDEIKVVLPDQQTNLEAIYNATGIGYYFVLDTTNRQFKLPRNTYGFTGYRGDVGGYVAPGLPNITGRIYNGTRFLYADKDNFTFTNTGALFAGDKESGGAGCTQYGNGTGNRSININAALSNSIYGNSTTVQTPATQAYLYFYVGNTVQNETSVDVAEMTEALNSKADRDLLNLSNGLANTICTTTPTTVSTATSARPAVIVENYVNGTSWYRVWSDGWCEQGGQAIVNNTTTTVTFLKPYIDTNYYCNCRSITTNTYGSTASIENRTATSMGIRSQSNATWCWLACGYIN